MYGLCRGLCIVCIVFCFPLLFTYSVGLKRSCFKPYTAADAAPWQCRVCAVLNFCDYFSEFKKFQSEMLGRKERRCVIIANLLRCYRIRAWSCTSDVRKKRRLRQDVVCLVAVSSEWTRRELNPRPNGEIPCFLHAYHRLGFRA